MTSTPTPAQLVARTPEDLAEKVQLVVSRHGQPQEVPAAKAQEALGRPISFFLPEDAKAINRANNHGVPVVIEAPSAKVSRAIGQIAAISGASMTEAMSALSASRSRTASTRTRASR